MNPSKVEQKGGDTCVCFCLNIWNARLKPPEPLTKGNDLVHTPFPSYFNPPPRSLKQEPRRRIIIPQSLYD